MKYFFFVSNELFILSEYIRIIFEFSYIFDKTIFKKKIQAKIMKLLF